jgi:hypothetical protein
MNLKRGERCRSSRYKLFASGGKRSSNPDLESGQAKLLDQGEIDLKLLKDLNQHKK